MHGRFDWTQTFFFLIFLVLLLCSSIVLTVSGTQPLRKYSLLSLTIEKPRPRQKSPNATNEIPQENRTLSKFHGHRMGAVGDEFGLGMIRD